MSTDLPNSPALEGAPGGAPPVPPVAVVAIGGSAGALDSYERFFLGLSPTTGMAFIVVPHLDPDHRGLMPDLLERCTSMPVVQLEDGMPLLADRVHVIPPGFSLVLADGAAQLEGLDRAEGRVIDRVFASLALDQRERAVAVVLSGLGTDGTRGLEAVKTHGGWVLVEDPRTAAYPDMPRSAAGTQLADDVLPVEDLAARLMGFGTLPQSPGSGALKEDGTGPGAPLQRILWLVRSRVGHDFTQYKRATLVRRINRRMKGHHLEHVAEYLQLLERSPDEVEALFQDFTINVTSFFRDLEAFEALKTHLRASIQAHKQTQDTFRVWVTACSTGEEAYSVAIVLSELIEELSATQRIQVQIFATDIDQAAVNVARQGRYPRAIAYVVSPERLHRYFQLSGGQYQVRAELRELVVFATHSTFGDPPFTRLDLLCCRNLLIYIGTELQQQLLETFVYALRPSGLLFLGASETVGPLRDYFTALDTRWKIFRRQRDGARLPTVRAPFRTSAAVPPPTTGPLPPDVPVSAQGSDLARQVQRTLLADHAPPAVVVNTQGEVLYVHGRTARYLELPTGHLPNTIFELVPEPLRYQLRTAMRQVEAERRAISLQGVRLERAGRWQILDVELKPLQAGLTGPLLITFREHADADLPGGPEVQGDHGTPAPGDTPPSALELELRHERETLQTTVRDMAQAMEELRSSHEALQSANEELQSTNEELTTSKEELQSLNEELHTVGAEHRLIIQEQAEANDDIRNLLDSSGTAIIFLNRDLRIRRFTPPIRQIVPLTPSDLGRPLADLNVRLRYPHLTRDLLRVLETLEPLEAQVQTHAGEWYLMRLGPYRTHDNQVGGVVLAFTSIQLVKSLEWRLVSSLQHAESMMDNLQDPLLLLEQHVRAATASRMLLQLLQSTTLTLDSERSAGTDQGDFGLLELERRLREVVASEEPLSSALLELNVSRQRARRLRVEAELVIGESGPSQVVGLRLGEDPVPEQTGAAAPPDRANEETPPPPGPESGEP